MKCITSNSPGKIPKRRTNMDWLKNLITVYLVEASNDAPLSDDEIAYRAENFCKDAERIMKARLDFKDLGKEDK